MSMYYIRAPHACMYVYREDPCTAYMQDSSQDARRTVLLAEVGEAYLLTYLLACLLAYLLTVLLAKVRDAYFVTY